MDVKIKQTARSVLVLMGMGLSSGLLASEPSLTTQTDLKTAFTPSFKHRYGLFQLGGYWGSQGKSQQININSLIGDRFTTTHTNGRNGLAGVGYFVEGGEHPSFKMSYGVNAFYLAKTPVVGEVVQEDLFTNLSYRYDVTHYPVYAMAKSTINTTSSDYAVTVDVGIGPNFMQTRNLREQSLDGITIPDDPFSNHTTTTFSATVGVGLNLAQTPLSCGYRFFYLGQGHFTPNNNQIMNTLTTGSAFANALMCSMRI